MAGSLYKPGTDNLPAGHYKEVGPRGGEVKMATVQQSV